MRTSNKYRKRPVVIEAFQMTPERREDNGEWPEWLNAAWQMEDYEIGSVGMVSPSDLKDRHICIRTLEGRMLVSWGDYIIQGVAGEVYPCKPDIFAATYDEVTS